MGKKGTDETKKPSKIMRFEVFECDSLSGYIIDTRFTMATKPRFNMLQEIGVNEETLNSISDTPGRTLATTSSGWSKEVCLKKAELYKIPSEARDAAQVTAAVTRFLQFYASGAIANTHTISDTVLSVAVLIFKDKARTLQDLIWPESFYSSNEDLCGFSYKGLQPLEVDLHDKSSTNGSEHDDPLTSLQILSNPIELQTIKGISFETSEERSSRMEKEKTIRIETDIEKLTSITKQFLHNYQAGSLREFLTAMAEVTIKYPITNGINRIHIHLFKTVNFLALTMLRTIIKSKAQMTTAFLKEQYKRNIASLVSGPISCKYAPPSKGCLDVLESLSKNDPAISGLLAKIVNIWTDPNKMQPSAQAIVGATVLTHLAWNGMGILHLLFEVCKHHAVSWKDIMKYTLFNTTKMSWKSIFSFFREYQVKDSEDATVAWARIIDDSYFTELGTHQHVTLAALLIESVIESQGDEGILSAYWASTHPQVVEHYRAASAKLRDILSGTSKEIVAGAVEAMQIQGYIGQPLTERQFTSKNPPTSPDVGFSAEDL